MADEVDSGKKPAKPAAAKAGRKKAATGAGAKRSSSASGASGARKASPKASAKPSGPDETHREAGQAGGAPPANTKPSADSDLIEKLWRLVAMIAFGLIGFFAYHAVAIVALAQFIVVLIRDEPNRDLQQAAFWLNAYLNQVLDYLAYRTEEMPFPLGEKPSISND